MDTTHALHLDVSFPVAMDVRRFDIREGLHQLFRVELELDSPDPDIDLNRLVGADARFGLKRATTLVGRGWSGIITRAHQVGLNAEQISTYRIVIEPRLWLLTQRRNYRVFQQQSDPEIVLTILAEWGIKPRVAYAPSAYLGRKYRVQYAESDYAFISRLLEDAGITLFFEHDETGCALVLSDAPHAADARGRPLVYENAPIGELLREIATNVRVTRRVRPGRYTQRDVDYRRSADYPLVASESVGDGVEARLERFHQNYGAFLFSAEADGTSPTADDHGCARTNVAMGERQVKRRLAAKRSDARRCTFVTTAHDLAPGHVFSFGAHPRSDLADDRRLLVVSSHLSGGANGDWIHEVDASFADSAYHPPLRTPKPRTLGVESATVVGPPDDEIHTDEFARVRVQFHWDRVGARDPRSSCWIPVSQPWGGASFGALSIPRVGQEVLVDFLGEDPDRPVIVGRVFTKTNPVPYALPHHKTVSGIRSQSSNQFMKGMVNAAAGALGAALGKAVGEALSDAFGDTWPPLASMIPDMAGMLCKLPTEMPAPTFPPLPDFPSAPVPPSMPSMPGSPAGPGRLPTPSGGPPGGMGPTPTPPTAPGGMPSGPGPAPQTPSMPSTGATPPMPGEPAGPSGLGTPPRTSMPVDRGTPPIPSGPDGVPTGPGPVPEMPTMPTAPATPQLPSTPGGPPPLQTPPAPGALPEMPMGPDLLQQSLEGGFPAFSPGDEAHRWVGSELTMDDTLGQERLYMQAQRDMNIVVKNNFTAVIGASRTINVGTSDILDVGHQQVIFTKQDRALVVNANQVHSIHGDVSQVSLEGSQAFSTALEFGTISKKLAITAEERLVLRTGIPIHEIPAAPNAGVVVMAPEFVVLHAPELFLNPGEAALAQAKQTGEAPQPAAEERADAAQAAIDAPRAVLERAWEEGNLASPSDYPRLAEPGSPYHDELQAFDRGTRDQAWYQFNEAHLPEGTSVYDHVPYDVHVPPSTGIR